jgi:hypothetical protein
MTDLDRILGELQLEVEELTAVSNIACHYTRPEFSITVFKFHY